MNIKGNSKLIIPVDWMSLVIIQEVFDIIKKLDKEYTSRIFFKFNDQLFKIWADWVNELMTNNSSFRTMQDPKFHDIPPTVANWIKQLAESGLSDKTEYITIHASWWEDMIKASVEKKKELWLDTKILAVTVLTTLWEKWSQQSFDDTAKHWVLKLAKLALESWADGIVCSPLEAPVLRAVYWKDYPDFFIVTPWIRFADSNSDHQTRITTPSDWIEYADDLVMWSPIINKDKETWLPDAEKMNAAIKRFFTEVDSIESREKNISYELERLLYTWKWEELLRYIWAFYNKPEWWKYCRLASGLLSNAYINIWATERNYLVLERASTELANKLNIKLWLNKVLPENIDTERSNYVVMWAQMGSVRISSYLAEKMGIETSIYTEKSNSSDDKVKNIKKYIESINDTAEIKSNTIIDHLLKIIDEDTNENMSLKRHDIDLTWKKIILSEDIITKWSTLTKMIKLVRDRWWEVVAVSCLWNRYWKDNFEWIPLISCYIPPVFELYYDDKTPEKSRWNYALLWAGSKISEKPKNDWKELVKSMR